MISGSLTLKPLTPPAQQFAIYRSLVTLIPIIKTIQKTMSKGKASNVGPLIACLPPVGHPQNETLSKYKIYPYILTCEDFTTEEDNDFDDTELSEDPVLSSFQKV